MTSARYRISHRLGQGGMAEVFEAEVLGDLGFSRKVAIKRMLAPAAADVGAARRFLDEARIASRLHHANIVAVMDVGLLDDLPFQVLEFVDGIDANQLQHRAGGVLPLEVALAIITDVAYALDHAHRVADASGVPLGVVHRDVKPSNVLVSWSGDVKLADFGIALARDREARTETGIVAGTLGFIAPEQRTRGEVDGRADVFALGLTLHAFLTGYTPLREVAVEMQLIEGQPVPLDPALPPEVKALVMRACAPSRLDRPSAAEFATAVGALVTGDRRSVLRTFLDTIDVAPRKPKRGALDDLLGIEVILEAAGDVPQYKTVAATPKKLSEATTRATPVEPPPRRRWLALLLVIALLVAGGIGAWRLAASRSSSPVIDAAVANVEIDAAILDASLPDTTIVIAPVLIDAAPRVVRDKHRPIDAAVTPPPSSETGWLQVVGGESLVGGKVIVDDGRWTWTVPEKRSLPVGVHRVEVIKPDGITKLPPKTIEVTTFHSKRNVAKLRFD